MPLHHQHLSPLEAETLRIPPDHGFNRMPLVAGVLGGVGIVASLLLALRDPQQFYFSWLVAFLFFLSLALGALFFVLVHFVTNASWSVVLRRLAENTMGTLPWFILFFLPIAAGTHDLFHWAHTEEVAHDALLLGKRAYLNVPFFMIRAAVYLTSWAALAWWFLRTSRQQDRVRDRASRRRMIKVSAPALFIFAITLTFAAVDWIMSLDPHWYSTMFGVYYFSGCLVGIFAFLVILAAALRRAGLLTQAISTEHFHDLGKLLFGFTVFWAYIAFCQYFLMWYANIPEETQWYLRRAAGGWKTLSILLAVGHFIVPFFYLMPRTIKRRTSLLVAGACWMLLMHFVDVYWLVMPAHHGEGVHLSLLDFTTFAGLGGLFLAAVGWRMRRHALVPVGDLRLPESLSFENV